MARKTTQIKELAFTPSQEERRALVLDGRTVLANLRHDKELISWAQSENLYTRIDRRSRWGNPFEIGEDGDREAVIESFRLYLMGKRELLEQIGDLRGRVLGCWCYPEPCHGCVLIDQLMERPGEHDAHRGLHCPQSDGS